MIISHEHKFIFLKTAKTAGTSVEIALSKWCGERDIITPVSPEDEKIRRELGYRNAQNFAFRILDYGANDWAYVLRNRRRKKFSNHIPARLVTQLVGEDIWSSYYKFCFERNPWDRVVSLYYWLHKQEPRPSISQFIASGAPRALKSKGFDVYTIDGRIAVDRVCRYEQLQEDLNLVCQRELGLPEILTLPKAKGGFRMDRRPYRDLMNDADRDRVAAMFAQEIAHFGYEY